MKTRCCSRSAVLLILGFLCFMPTRSFAHTFPHHADPRVGSTVAAPPSSVRIWFDGDLEPTFCTISVEDSGGKKVDKGDGHVDSSDPKLLQVGVQALQKGTYHVIWKVVARDGHRTEGDYRFTVK